MGGLTSINSFGIEIIGMLTFEESETLAVKQVKAPIVHKYTGICGKIGNIFAHEK
jgi:hypothetical protein